MGAGEKGNRERKRGTGTDILFWIVVIALICVMGFSLYKIGKIAYGYLQGRNTYDKIAEEAGAHAGADDVEVDFNKLRKKYPDVKAWLYSKGTIINYPVAQGKDNDWYLHHTLDGKWNGAGTLFIDNNNERPFKDFLTIIYGHHMRDGSMFGSLVKYRDEDYYRKHKTLKLYTPGHKYDLDVIGVCTIPGASERYQIMFADDDEKQEYLDWIDSATEMECEAGATVDDRIVMLSTCTYEFDNARLVVFAKIVPVEE